MTMKRNQLKTLLLGGVLAVFAGACSDGTTAPADVLESDAAAPATASSATGPSTPAVLLPQGNYAGEGPAVCNNPDINKSGDTWLGIKVDPPKAGTYAGFVITLSMPDGSNFRELAWDGTGTSNVMKAVIVKPGSVSYAYYYNPPLADGGGYYREDSGLGGVQQAISHYVLCYIEAPYMPLEVEKTAAATYDRTVEWDLEKTVDPATHTGYAGETAGSSTWTVVATKSETSDNYKVEGTITITNPNDIPVDFTVSDVLDDDTVADVTCPSYTVTANDYVTCTYEAEPEDDSATKNTVVVTSLTGGVGGDSAEAAFDWVENLIGYDQGTLSDPRFVGEPWNYAPEAISLTTTRTFDETFLCSADAGAYTNGHYQYTETNTAYLNDDIDLEDSATVTVDCYLPALAVAKTAEGTFDRTVEWDLEKLVDGKKLASFSGAPGDAFHPTWEVTATKDETFGDVVVTGEIRITNPAAIPQTFSISDLLDDHTVATVTCPSTGDNTGTVPAKVGDVAGEVTCTYTASPTDASAEENVATVTAPGNAPQDDTATIDWEENLTGYDEGTLSDPRFTFSELINSSTTETFPETFYCPPLDSGLYVDGFYSFSEVNRAYLNDNIGLEDSAEVRVECAAPVKGYTAWAANGDEPLSLRYTPRGNWATFVEYAEKTVTLFAGQFHKAGTVTFSGRDNGEITITINLDSGWMFEDVAENVKIQDYASAPSGNPPVGLFAHKGEGSGGSTFSITVPANNFYGVHVNVMGPENP